MKVYRMEPSLASSSASWWPSPPPSLWSSTAGRKCRKSGWGGSVCGKKLVPVSHWAETAKTSAFCCVDTGTILISCVCVCHFFSFEMTLNDV